MLNSEYAEDLFVKFYYLVALQKFPVQGQDFSPICSFYEKISSGEALTKNQANFLVKLLEKYKNISATHGLDYRSNLSELKFKNDFRVLDLSKKVYVENRNGKLEICLKFPYQLKDVFEKEINVNLPTSERVSHWDPQDKVRRLSLYDFNLIAIYEFAVRHNFEIDDTFMNVVSEIEEIWQNADDVSPFSDIDVDKVVLRNASDETLEWWENNKSGIVSQDLLLAKSMGFFYHGKALTYTEKISSHLENMFWIKTNEEFFKLANCFTDKIVIVLDRTSKTLSWLQAFVSAADKFPKLRNEIRVCFRDNKDSTSGLNDWIKSAGVGGKVEDGKILIFESKPAKWLFKQQENVIMLVTNNIYPPTNNLARDWFHSHPCVVYLGDTRPTETKGHRIVEL